MFIQQIFHYAQDEGDTYCPQRKADVPPQPASTAMKVTNLLQVESLQEILFMEILL